MTTTRKNYEVKRTPEMKAAISTIRIPPRQLVLCRIKYDHVRFSATTNKIITRVVHAIEINFRSTMHVDFYE